VQHNGWSLSPPRAREQFEKEYILSVLAENKGKVKNSADVLGIQRSHLWKKMKRFGINKKNTIEEQI
jgi:two-component system, NtrC family, nitrogen regulation response regulator NtrX